MPSISDHQSATAAKCLLVGHSGAGKTVALATLANQGYRLFIIDYDNGLDALRHFVRPEFHKNVFFKTCIDPVADVQGRIAGIPQAATRGFTALDNWVEDAASGPIPGGRPIPGGTLVSLGGVKSWGGDDVIVIDSLTLQGQACMNYALALNGRLGQRPTMGDWGDAIKMQENMLSLLYSDAIKCNVVVTAHLAFQEDITAGGLQKGFPSALGSKLPPKVGRYFNSVLLVESGQRPPNAPGGGPLPRLLRLQSSMSVELKTPLAAPPPSLQIDPGSVSPSGLAAYFQLVTGSPPPAARPAATAA